MSSSFAASPEAPRTPMPPPPGPPPTDAERFARFGEAIDRVRARVEAELGPADVEHIRRVNAVSRTLEVVGRVLLHFSFEPVGFTAGVLALWVHKQLQATEVGHTALHGAYDGLEGAEAFRSATFRWDLPIDEESWRAGHNVRHHQYTNVAGKDPDIHFGTLRLNARTPYAPAGALKVPLMLLATVPNFGVVMNAHFTGLVDLYVGNGRPEKMDFLPDRSWGSIVSAHKRAYRKYVPYFLKNYLFFPLLAGPGFFKVLLGNWLAETLRDIYSAASIYCGHVGEDVADYPEGTRARGRGAWYAMQVEAANDFEVSLPISILCGALDRQIEHHLFPKFPPNRLREIAPEIRALCEAHGIRYNTGSWGSMLKKTLRRITKLNGPEGGSAGLRDVLEVAA